MIRRYKVMSSVLDVFERTQQLLRTMVAESVSLLPCNLLHSGNDASKKSIVYVSRMRLSLADSRWGRGNADGNAFQDLWMHRVFPSASCFTTGKGAGSYWAISILSHECSFHRFWFWTQNLSRRWYHRCRVIFENSIVSDLSSPRQISSRRT